MTPALARIKRGCRQGIDLCGGKTGAAATAGRCESVAASWGTLHHPAFPPLDAAFALDEVAIAQGREPPIVAAMARELGGVFVPLPDAQADADTVAGMVMALAAQLGDLSREVSASIADGRYEPHEATRTLDPLGRLEAVSARLRITLAAIEATPSRRSSGGG